MSGLPGPLYRGSGIVESRKENSSALLNELNKWLQLPADTSVDIKVECMSHDLWWKCRQCKKKGGGGGVFQMQRKLSIIRL